MTDDDPRRRWRVTSGAAWTVFGGLVLVAVGLLAGRPDVVVIGIPLVLTVASALSRPPGEHPGIAFDTPFHVEASDEVGTLLTVVPATAVPAVRVRVSAPGHRPVEALLDARRAHARRLLLTTVRTGRQDTFGVDDLAFGTGAAVVASARHHRAAPIVLLPRAEALRELPLPWRLHGVTGAHGSRRPGEGGDLRDVAMLAPGDRLRHIDWRTTARRGSDGGRVATLYVRRTFATSDAHVMLVIDPRDDIGPDVSTWSGGPTRPDVATSLDVARHAATSLARGYLDQGDRVGLVSLRHPRQLLLPAGGRRHLHRLRHQLATAEPVGTPTSVTATPRIPAGVLVVVLSTFLDDLPVELARRWRLDGHRVLAVDVLPTPVLDALPWRGRVAFRMVWLERVDRLDRLREAGVELIRWAGRGHGPVVADLATLARSRQVRR